MALAGFGAVAGCARIGRSRLNPVNWFGRAERVETVAAPVQGVSDPRPLVPQVTNLTVERNPGGAIVRATGLPPVQGWHGAALVPVPNAGQGVLAYQFRALPPAGPTRVSTERSRELVVAVFLTDQALAGVREIQVSGATNALAARR
ncbi:hypothetical protein JM664_00755 [Rhodobacteraceae bacterium MCCB 386]|nr:hypothetical protein [Roseitranquillus sediminis]